jgi:hypothetical protein
LLCGNKTFYRSRMDTIYHNCRFPLHSTTSRFISRLENGRIGQ